jgi:hypothetical protein
VREVGQLGDVLDRPLADQPIEVDGKRHEPRHAGDSSAREVSANVPGETDKG